MATISIFLPPMPPAALIWFAASWAPLSIPTPMTFWSPVSGASSPMRTVVPLEAAPPAGATAVAAMLAAATPITRADRRRNLMGLSLCSGSGEGDPNRRAGA